MSGSKALPSAVTAVVTKSVAVPDSRVRSELIADVTGRAEARSAATRSSG